MESEEIIQKCLEQHRYIDENINSVAHGTSDINTMIELQRERSDIARSSLEELHNRVKILGKRVEDLYVFMKQHFKFEEDTFPALVDAAFMQMLLSEHEAIISEFEKVKEIVDISDKQAADAKDLLGLKTKVVNTLNNLCYLIHEHASKENKVLHELKAELEKDSAQG